jgi:hypothetical protein
MFDWFGLVTGVLGGTAASLVVVCGLSRWLGDVWRGRILEKVQQDNRKELEALKSEMQSSVDRANRLLDAGISKAILVTRTHFETEFTAYKEIFAALSEVKHCIRATRPMLTIEGELTLQEKKEQLLNRLRDLMKAHNNALTLSDNLSPFYSEEINQSISKCLKASGLEISEIKLGGDGTFHSQWFQQGQKRQDEFMEGYNETAKLIRERLASLGVLPG